MNYRDNLFDVSGKVVVITGGSGVLGSALACDLAERGARLALLSRNPAPEKKIEERLIRSEGDYTLLACDVLDRESVKSALRETLNHYGRVDVLINGAGGNDPRATTSAEKSFFDIPAQAFNNVLELNLTGTVIPSQVFGAYFAQSGRGVILNISSMNAFRPLTRIPAYSAAKAALSNFTQWLAVHMAQEYSPKIRVNAIAPGFFLTRQNRFLLVDKESGKPTPRGLAILQHTPAGRYGAPEDLAGAVIWLISDASCFVTGTVVAVDGGFSAFSGV
ncbi:MAG TPA: SDR family oxidoreductase [Caldithrix abyssi]|uniref:SDR family oxidoreductase n=1 Tax=Caldithrix abyssi TaxID=187145 RepID=A0A7V1PVG8_CALAY|nr:SDR family oxidoreductase [Caldithrix abyssi]